MTDENHTTTTDPSGTATERPAPALDPSATTPGPPPAAEGDPAGGNERPEIFVAGAFLGGLVAALVLKRVARG